MTWMNLGRNVFFLLLAFLPFITTAQLSSTNYQIDGYSIVDPRVSTATSTNYEAGFAPGPVYIFDAATTSSSSPSGGSGGGSRPNSDVEDVPSHPEAPQPSTTTVVFVTESITCDSESLFPNWGTGGPNITFDTAKNWVANNPGCYFEAGNEFQWANAGTPNPGSNYIGKAGQGWFDFPPTNADGYTAVEVPFSDITNISHVWIRTVNVAGDLPFTFNNPYPQRNQNDVTAEFYCHTDVLNYDNYDRVDRMIPGNTYFCVSWNLTPDAVWPDGVLPIGEIATSAPPVADDPVPDENFDDETPVDIDVPGSGSSDGPVNDPDGEVESTGGVLPNNTPPIEQTSVFPTLRSVNRTAVFEAVQAVTTAAEVVAVPGGLGAGVIFTTFGVFKIPFSLTHIGRFAMRLPSNFFGLLVFWRRRKPWGTVYDSVTKEPLDPAYVELFDLAGEKQAEAITDLDGRYGFLVPEGEYVMKVSRSNYEFPARRLPGVSYDVLYNNLYFGGPFTVAGPVAHDIPLDKKGFDWNQFEKMRTKQTRYFSWFDPIVAAALQILFFVGLLAMVWQFYTEPSVLTGALLAIYVVLFVLRIVRGAPPLYGTITKDGTPLSYAVIRIYRDDREVTQKVADQYGRFVFLVPPSQYTIKVEQLVGENEYETVYTGPVDGSSGVVNQSLRL